MANTVFEPAASPAWMAILAPVASRTSPAAPMWSKCPWVMTARPMPSVPPGSRASLRSTAFPLPGPPGSMRTAPRSRSTKVLVMPTRATPMLTLIRPALRVNAPQRCVGARPRRSRRRPSVLWPSSRMTTGTSAAPWPPTPWQSSSMPSGCHRDRRARAKRRKRGRSDGSPARRAGRGRALLLALAEAAQEQPQETQRNREAGLGRGADRSQCLAFPSLGAETQTQPELRDRHVWVKSSAARRHSWASCTRPAPRYPAAACVSAIGERGSEARSAGPPPRPRRPALGGGGTCHAQGGYRYRVP